MTEVRGAAPSSEATRRRRAPGPGEIAVYASYVLVAGGLTVISLEPRFATPWWIPSVLGVSGLAVLALRRSRLLPALVLAIGLAVVSAAVGTGAESLLVVLVLYRVGVRRPAATAWACLGLAVVGGGVGALVFTHRLASGPSLWGSPPVTPRDPVLDGALACALVTVLLLVTALLGTSAGQRRRRTEALVERAEQLTRERDQQAEIASARERERIAREMHDVIAHSLSVIIAVADGARAVSEARPDEAGRAVALISDTGRQALGEVRLLLGSVRGDDAGPTPPGPQPDASHLTALVDQFRTAGLPIRSTVTGPAPAGHAVGLTVYRIVQESLTNVLRHARAVQQVDVTVRWDEGAVSLEVCDTAAERPDAPRAGRGILGMRERVALFDGVIDTGPRAEGGWRVAARLTWEDHDDDR